jgi:hypothetical protein
VPSGNPGQKRGPNSPETRRKKSESAQRRWDEMKPETEIRLRKQKSKGMRLHWKKFTKEERHIIGMRGAVSRFKTKLRKLGTDEAEIEALVKERYSEWID